MLSSLSQTTWRMKVCETSAQREYETPTTADCSHMRLAKTWSEKCDVEGNACVRIRNRCRLY